MKTKLKQNNKAITSSNNQKGITLIALVITIIVLIILAGVSVNLSLGENGIFRKTKEAKEMYDIAAYEEMMQLYQIELYQEENKDIKDLLVRDNLINEEELEKNGIANINEKVIVVNNFNGLKKISDEVENGNTYKEKTIFIINDIDCGAEFKLDTGELISGENFMPIGDCNSSIEDEGKETSIIKKFDGYFNGLGYSIKNLYIKENENTEFCTGLFGYVGENGVIENLNISSSYIQGYFETGAFVGRNKGKIINCINESKVVGDYYLTGGISGRNTNLIDTCINKGTVIGGVTQIGGIVANCDLGSNVRVLNCENYGNVRGLQNSHGIGGIVGGAYKSTEQTNIIISNCKNKVDITNSTCNNVAGIVGKVNSVKIQNCINNGEILGYTSVGGIVGTNTSGDIENCKNYKKITANYCASGGICGTNAGNISKCCNLGYIYMPETGYYGIGGIAGRCWIELSDASITLCYNVGKVYSESTSSGQAGGIVGNIASKNDKKIEVVNCYNAEEIYATKTAGGIAGFIKNVTIKNCYNIGNIKGSGHIGAIVAYKEGTENEINNNYWLDSCGAAYGIAYQPTNEGTIFKTDTELQELTTLSEAYMSDTQDEKEEWKYNNGYPILKWQCD